MLQLAAPATNAIVLSCWMLAGVFFILSLKGLSSQEGAKRGNLFGMYGMAIAIFVTFFSGEMDAMAILKFFIAMVAGGTIGLILALKVMMEQMPQLVAALHSFVGVAATIVGFANFFATDAAGINLGVAHNIEIYLGIFIGALTLMGSIIACGKLHGTIGSDPLILFGINWIRHIINASVVIAMITFCVLFCIYPKIGFLLVNLGLAIFLGWHWIMAIGGGDMPVVVSMLNSCSGWALAASGFMLNQDLLIIAGGLIGFSGAILSHIMCTAMNRSFVGVMLGGFGGGSSDAKALIPEGATVTETNVQEVVKDLLEAQSIVIVPGYGMAMARCQNDIGAIVEELRKKGKKIEFSIHPVAGRLPGHMNVLLAEAKVPYNIVKESDEVNKEMDTVDVALVIGANDTINSDALDNPNSVMAGMPMCEVWRAKKCIVNKRNLGGKGYAGIDNPVFWKKNTSMLFGNADVKFKEILDEIRRSGKKGEISAQGSQDKSKAKVAEKDPKSEKDYPRKKYISVPKESHQNERRVAITPAGALKFLEEGFGTYFEKGCGVEAGFTDEQYENNGAIPKSHAQLWNEADILIKIRPPTLAEAQLLNPEATFLISQIFPGDPENKEMIAELNREKSRSKLNVLALEQIPRTTRAQKLDTLSSTNGFLGYRAAIEAFNEFPRYSQEMMTAAGKATPAKVFILGAAVAGLQAIGVARNMGAIVKATDVRTDAKSQAESLGAEFVYPETDEGTQSGVYAGETSEKFKQAQKDLLVKECKEADIVITTALIPGKPAPKTIPKSVVDQMKPGSIIVDIAAERGGNCTETQPGKKITTHNGVIIIGYTDLASRMGSQASEFWSANMFNLFQELCKKGPAPTDGSKPVVDKMADRIALDPKDDLFNPKGMLYLKDGVVQDRPQQPAPTPPVSAGYIPERPEWKIPPYLSSLFVGIPVIIIAILLGFGTENDYQLLFDVFVFILACFIGYMVVWGVTPALHTPLMSETNAISGIIVIGPMLQLASNPFWVSYSICGFIGVFFASINIFGGFVVTQKMLNMFTADPNAKEEKKGHH
jgi:NAD(P) transhydrogenase